jgi:hypothetical protein
MNVELKILSTIEEQTSVQFTGKVNILAAFNRQYLGHVLFKNGEIYQVIFQNLKGLKAFYHLIIQEYSLQSFNYVVEPEVVNESERQIHYPYAVMRNKMADVIQQFKETVKFRPPDNVKILIEPKFIEGDGPITPEEFSVLETLTEWNSPIDIYQHCQLLDHEITRALVNLRKKNALKIVGNKIMTDDSP